MKKKLYDEYVDVSETFHCELRRCFINHLIIYNKSLAILHDLPETSFNVFKKQVKKIITDSNLKPIIESALLNELYYQYKKFKRNIKIQKLITDIQYFTFLTNGYSCKSLRFEGNQITFVDILGSVQLTTPLPDLSGKLLYINFSYSNTENRYKLSLCETA